MSAVECRAGLVMAHWATSGCGLGVPTGGPLLCVKSSRRDAADEGANGGRLSPFERCRPIPITFFFFPGINRLDDCSSVEFVGSYSSKFDETDRGIGDSFLRDENSELDRLGRSWSSLFSSLTIVRLRDDARGAGIGGRDVFSLVFFVLSFIGFSDEFR